MTRFNVDLQLTETGITGTIETETPAEPDHSAAIAAFLENVNPKLIEAKAAHAGYGVSPVEATLDALKEMANGRG